MQKIGKILEERRKQLGYSIDDICNKTKLPFTTIEALEKGDFDHFENDLTYVKFYLKAYCKVLDIDYEEIRGDFDKSYTEYSQSISLSTLRNHEQIEKSISEKSKAVKKENDENREVVVNDEADENESKTVVKTTPKTNQKTMTSKSPMKTKKAKKWDLSMVTLIVIVAVVVGVLIFSGTKLAVNKINNPDTKATPSKQVPQKEVVKKDDNKTDNSGVTITTVNDNIYDVTGIKPNEEVTIEIKFNADCWMNGVSDNGLPVQNIVAGQYGPNNPITYKKVATGNDVIAINCGNYKAATIYVNGKPVQKTPVMQEAGLVNIQLNLKAA